MASKAKVGLPSISSVQIDGAKIMVPMISSPSALAWHEEIIDNREDEQCQQKPVEYRFPFALEKLVCVHFPFAFSPRSTVSGQAEWLRSPVRSAMALPPRVSRP